MKTEITITCDGMEASGLVLSLLADLDLQSLDGVTVAMSAVNEIAQKRRNVIRRSREQLAADRQRIVDELTDSTGETIGALRLRLGTKTKLAKRNLDNDVLHMTEAGKLVKKIHPLLGQAIYSLA